MLTVDLDAIAANYRTLCGELGGSESAAVVKADGYGLGAAPVARRLAAEGCRRFFVSDVDEGGVLRAALDDIAADAVIHVLDGVGEGAEGEFDRARLVPVLGDPGQIERWAAHGRAHGGRSAIIEVDTGMGRMGLGGRELDDLAAAPARLDGIAVAYVMSHLACADDPDDPMNARQLAAFAAARARLPGARASLANSAGIFLGPDYHFDLARPGGALFGVSSAPNRPSPMAQVVGLQGKVVRLRDVDTDMTVGYGATRRIAGGCRIATVAVGYADGYPRALGNLSTAYVGDIPVPIVGRVSMDLVTFDVSEVPTEGLRPGDSIEMIGAHHTADDLARDAGTIGYEILTGLGPRLHRIYIGKRI